MKILNHPRKTFAIGLAAAVIALGGAGAAAVSPVAAMPPGGQSCPGVGLLYKCGEYDTEAECTEALNARHGLIDGQRAWCFPPGPSSPKWELVASISG